LAVVSVIDENCSVNQVVFLGTFTEKRDGQPARPGVKQPNMKEPMGVEVHGGVQPVALVVDLNHRFVHRDVIGSASVAGWRLVSCIQSWMAVRLRWTPNVS